MATLRDSQFGVQVSHVPWMNIRFEFNDLLGLFRKQRFRDQFRGHQGKQIPVRTHYFTWHGRPEALLTHLLREAIVGLESAVSGAVFLEALVRRVATDELLKATRNPLSLPPRGTVECVFNALPALIDPPFSLDARNPDLWQRTRTFYRELRNPVFHAYEISGHDPDPVWRALEFLWELYGWLNSWHPVELLLSGPVQWAPGTAERVTEIREISDAEVEQLISTRSLPPARRVPAEHVLPIEDVTGLSLPSDDMAELTATKPDGSFVNLALSPHAAMKLLGFLSVAQRHRGWQIPDRLW